MHFNRTTLSWDRRSSDSAALCAELSAWRWTIEAGCGPPDQHDPARLLRDDGISGALALSLGSATAIGLCLGPALTARLADFGLIVGPLAGLALHELIVNAVIHGNLKVPSGRSNDWCDLGKRHNGIAEALADPVRSTRTLTVAVGWRAGGVIAIVADEGAGYDVNGQMVSRRGSGRGLRIARLAGDVSVRCGGRQTAIALECFLPASDS
jgi:hypothetical protein